MSMGFSVSLFCGVARAHRAHIHRPKMIGKINVIK